MLLRADGSLLLTGNYTETEGINPPVFDAAASDPGVPGEDSSQDAAKSSFVPLVPEKAAASEFGAVKKIVLGYNSIYVIASDGRLWAAGSNRYGQLSLGFDTETSPALKLINP